MTYFNSLISVIQNSGAQSTYNNYLGVGIIIYNNNNFKETQYEHLCIVKTLFSLFQSHIKFNLEVRTCNCF